MTVAQSEESVYKSAKKCSLSEGKCVYTLLFSGFERKGRETRRALEGALSGLDRVGAAQVRGEEELEEVGKKLR